LARSAIFVNAGGSLTAMSAERLPVELDVRLPAAGDELVVREPLLARGRVDPHDPEAAERALLALAVAVGVVVRLLDGLLRLAIGDGALADVALGAVEYLAALLARVDGSLDAGHCFLLLQLAAEQALDLADVALVHGLVVAEIPPALGGLLLEIVALHGVAPQHAARAGDLEPLLRG
jgi:hypothetical protein